MTGKVAESLAGHDKGQLYLIIKEETDSYDLVDGKSKTMARPKKKNKKHVRVYTHTDTGDIGWRLSKGLEVFDHEIKHYLKSIRSE